MLVDPSIITTFYKFFQPKDVAELRLQLLKFCNSQNIKGTILIAEEGINATICGSRESINNLYNFVKACDYLPELSFKENDANFWPFQKLKVKIKPEIVTFKASDLDMRNVGEYLNSEQWNELLSDGSALIIDTRNHYEVLYGTFKNAVDPMTKNFSDFPKWAQKNLSQVDKKKKIGMFCTGGIRCEKSTAYLKQMGFENVYHLKDGIIKYLMDMKGKNSLWRGDCFVFDDRTAIDHNLEPTE